MNEIAVKVANVSKSYTLFDKPIERLKEAFFVKRKYGTVRKVLDNISFVIEKGDIIGIVGGNGAGKSTLLKIITGVLSPSSGVVMANGKISAILELGAGFNIEYSGIENIFLHGTMMGFSRSEMEKKVGEIIEFADIGEFIYQPVKTYSSGMFARLAFAVAINVNPDILIVDEVLAVGDVRFQTKCMNKMNTLKRNGTTIIFVSHSSDQVKRFCNNAVWINGGKVVEIGDASIVVDKYEEYMNKTNEQDAVIEKETEIFDESKKECGEQEKMGEVIEVKINKEEFNTFDYFEVEVKYELFEKVKDILLGVAILTDGDRDYIFGPNTYLEKVNIKGNVGVHVVKYRVPEINLLSGSYTIDVGIFNNKGLVCIDYKTDELKFNIVNKYFSEGLCYLKHEWKVEK